MPSLYLHVPFCEKKCSYCSFCSIVSDGPKHQKYVKALKVEMNALSKREGHRGLRSIFIGGGTPTVLPQPELAHLITFCLDCFPLTSTTVEISVEANPGTVDTQYLASLHSAGVNRISLGVQSFDDAELAAVGRIHSGAVAAEAVRSAKEAGFTNINLDLMYGLPGQTVDSWRVSLEKAIDLQPKHLSLYQLTVEEKTPLQDAVARGTVELPTEDVILGMDEITHMLCAASGLQRYEISNYALPGYECIHNLTYWDNGDYLACGASAVSSIDGVRVRRIEDVDLYTVRMIAGQSVTVETERLPPEASFRESVILGLRLTEGVSLQGLRDRYHIDAETYYGKTLINLLKSNLVEVSNTHLRLTSEGRSIANLVMAELV